MGIPVKWKSQFTQIRDMSNTKRFYLHIPSLALFFILLLSSSSCCYLPLVRCRPQAEILSIEILSEQLCENKLYLFSWKPCRAIELHNSKFTWGKVNYIHDNSLREGFVKRQEDWIYSSICNYIVLDPKIPEVIRIAPFLNYR